MESVPLVDAVEITQAFCSAKDCGLVLSHVVRKFEAVFLSRMTQLDAKLSKILEYQGGSISERVRGRVVRCNVLARSATLGINAELVMSPVVACTSSQRTRTPNLVGSGPVRDWPAGARPGVRTWERPSRQPIVSGVDICEQAHVKPEEHGIFVATKAPPVLVHLDSSTGIRSAPQEAQKQTGLFFWGGAALPHLSTAGRDCSNPRTAAVSMSSKECDAPLNCGEEMTCEFQTHDVAQTIHRELYTEAHPYYHQDSCIEGLQLPERRKWPVHQRPLNDDVQQNGHMSPCHVLDLSRRSNVVESLLHLGEARFTPALIPLEDGWIDPWLDVQEERCRRTLDLFDMGATGRHACDAIVVAGGAQILQIFAACHPASEANSLDSEDLGACVFCRPECFGGVQSDAGTMDTLQTSGLSFLAKRKVAPKLLKLSHKAMTAERALTRKRK